MRKILLAAVVLPLLGGVALAQSPNVGRNVDTSVGPEAWPDAAAQWAKLQGNVGTRAPTYSQQFPLNGQPIPAEQGGTANGG